MIRKDLSIDGLLKIARDKFAKISNPGRGKITSQDCLMSGLAIYGLKSPSLLKFEERLKDPKLRSNIQNLYHIENIPSDTYLRERLDVIEPKMLGTAFKAILSAAQRGKVLERFTYIDDYYLMSVDGTGHFSSHQIHCKNCCIKHHRDGTVTYYHQAIGAAIVHPYIKHVLPFMPEFVTKQDGDSKNDCERNASKRLLERIRREHPHMKLMVVEDGLASNAPHLKLLDELDMRYIIVAKKGDHEYLFDYVKHADKVEFEKRENGFVHQFSFVNGVPLNDANHDYEVNFMEYTQIDPKGKKTTWTWVTNFKITMENAYKIMRGGRARWHIENNTFNTLKNQGYNFEHNFGHGNAHLCSVMATLMFLIFFIDQLQLLVCKLFQAAKARLGSYASLWEEMRCVMRYFIFDSWEQLLYRITHNPP